ncbi:MAG TPA: hypothetical protein VFJ02_20290 [Vicinamibacterales bacterium]|nr:hypothetical protein [Vicinamibacterales bacterium]
MSRAGVCLMVSVLCASVPILAHSERQRSRSTTRKPAAPPKPVPKIEPADVRCPEQLGVGVKTKASFCFVLAGRDPVEGVIVTIPPHKEATLTFDLHNRHTYSEEETRAGRGYAKYTAVIGVLSMSGALLGRGAVQSEFRNPRDLFDRITGGAGPGGVKAVAPLGREQVSISIPAGVDQVSLLGELLDGTTPAGREVATPGRPVAIVSNLQVEYLPAPPPRKR